MASLKFKDIKAYAEQNFPEAYKALPPLVKYATGEEQSLQLGTVVFQGFPVPIFVGIDAQSRHLFTQVILRPGLASEPFFRPRTSTDFNYSSTDLSLFGQLSWLAPNGFNSNQAGDPINVPDELDAYIRYWHAFHSDDGHTQVAPYDFLEVFEDVCEICLAFQRRYSDPLRKRSIPIS
jgi:hypothetical protein